MTTGKGRYDPLKGFKFELTVDDKTTSFKATNLPGVKETVQTFVATDAQKLIEEWRSTVMTGLEIQSTPRVGWRAVVIVHGDPLPIYGRHEVESTRDESNGLLDLRAAREFPKTITAFDLGSNEPQSLAYASTYRFKDGRATLYFLIEDDQPVLAPPDGPSWLVDIAVDGEDIGTSLNDEPIHLVFIEPVSFAEATKFVAEKELP